jgi:hypothetical protein
VSSPLLRLERLASTSMWSGIWSDTSTPITFQGCLCSSWTCGSGTACSVGDPRPEHILERMEASRLLAGRIARLTPWSSPVASAELTPVAAGALAYTHRLSAI